MNEKEKLIQWITGSIAEKFNPRRIIVFGGYAKSNPDPESEIDLFVEMESETPPLERSVEISSIFGLRNLPINVFVYTPEEVNRLRGVPGTLLSMIESEGKVLYERLKK